MPQLSQNTAISSYFIQYKSTIFVTAYKALYDLTHNYLSDFYLLSVSSMLTLLQTHSDPEPLYISWNALPIHIHVTHSLTYFMSLLNCHPPNEALSDHFI